MGKRKKSSRKPTGPKKREPLATAFTCLFCNHEKAIQVKLEKKLGVGTLSCKVCGQRFQTTINYLNAPVDVYSDWVDACEEVAHKKVDDELGGNASKATAEDMDFSTYGTENGPRRGVAADGDEDLINDDDY